VHVSAVEHRDHIVFLHTVEDGPASQSYGIQVAQLAGVPSTVVKSARKQLAKLERDALARRPQADLFAQNIVMEPERNPVLELLESIDPDSLTPKQALDAVYRLKDLMRKPNP
jgi:DNA mismatch repair protein MutS